MAPAKPRKYLTQCDCSNMWNGCGGATAQLDKPSRWRCDRCVTLYGKRPPDPRPTAPMP